MVVPSSFSSLSMANTNCLSKGIACGSWVFHALLVFSSRRQCGVGERQYAQNRLILVLQFTTW
jgi:hypothetical protein